MGEEGTSHGRQRGRELQPRLVRVPTEDEAREDQKGGGVAPNSPVVSKVRSVAEDVRGRTRAASAKKGAMSPSWCKLFNA